MTKKTSRPRTQTSFGKRTTYNRITDTVGGKQHTFRSKLEHKVALALDREGIPFSFEDVKLRYTIPEQSKLYLVDFGLQDNRILVEVKGRFDSKDRQKMKWVKLSNPDLDIRFVFANPNTKIRKGSETTYGMWCDQYGFPYAAKEVPEHWIT